jgi:glutathione S-transferase
MKLHFHPVSTTSRTVLLFCAEQNISYEPVVVDLMSGAHHKEPYTTLNPSSIVPTLEDGSFVLGESSAIVRYLADKSGSPAYPKDLHARARVNERLDWVNTQLGREYCYHLIYPQVFPHHVRSPEAVQKATLEWGREHSERWIKVLDQNFIGKNKYVCGDSITVADYFAAQFLATGDLIGVSFKRYPNVDRWMGTMRALPSWKRVNEAFEGFVASLRGKTFVTIS